MDNKRYLPVQRFVLYNRFGKREYFMQRKTDMNRLGLTLLEQATMQGGYFLVGFLNTANDRPEHAEVLKILDLCKEIDEIGKKADLTDQASAYFTRWPIALSALNSALRGFQFVPLVVGVFPGSFGVFWSSPDRRGFTPAEVERSITLAHAYPITSHGAVQMVLEMTEARTLDRIRKCFCGQWFFAQTNKKAVCSDACRFQKFKQGATFNEDHTTYMQNYRKNPKVKAKGRKSNAKTK
jgi:hypothetical protein